MEKQGGQVYDNVMCGENGPPPISDAAQAQVKAAIFLGDPHYVSGLAYGVGNCQASGVSTSHKPRYRSRRPLEANRAGKR